MKRGLQAVFIVIIAFISLGFGIAMADPLIPAHNETMGLQISTMASIDGQLKEDNEVAWETTTGFLDGTLSPPGPLITEFDGIYWIVRDNPVFDQFPGVSSGEVQYSTVYSEDTAANEGHTGYSNQFSLSNANKLPGESNIEVNRAIVFTSDTGSLSSNELLTLDGAGQFDFAEDRLICPFGAGESDFFPAFCNYVETGSNLLISSGSLATSAKERFVAQSSDNPLTVDYLIQLSGVNGPANGSVAAHMSGQTREGAVDLLYEIPFPDTDEVEMGTNYFVKSDLVSEMEFNEQTSVSGEISWFEKVMHYQSGVTL